MPLRAVAPPIEESLRLTLRDWAALREDEPGELVDGHLVEEEVTTFLHEAVVSWLIAVLRAWALPRGGWVFGSEAKFGIAPGRGRKADVSMYLPGARPPAHHERVSRTAPGVLVEVVSPMPRDARRDRVDKLKDYAKFGVRYYWLVDPQLRVVEILKLGAQKRYSIALSASEGRHAVPGCTELTLDLDALWAEVERLPDEEEEAERTTQRLKRSKIRKALRLKE